MMECYDNMQRVSQHRAQHVYRFVRVRASMTLVTLLTACMGACSTLPVVTIPSENANSRVNHLVLHFTSENFQESLAILTGRTDRKVSSHYLIPSPSDESYGQAKLKVYSLVPTEQRAWHAGRSFWAGKRDLNDQSVGVEIVNLAGCAEDISKLGNGPEFVVACSFDPFPEEQISLLIRLLKSVLENYPDIPPESIVGHADITPSRKVDPGPLFPWEQLYKAGIGAWFDNERAALIAALITQRPLSITLQQQLLAAYGYDVEVTGVEDEQSQLAVRAFQMHFRPSNYSGRFDVETSARLISLLERYRPRRLQAFAELSESLGAL